MKRLICLLSVFAAVFPCVSARSVRGVVKSDNDSTAVAGAVCRLLDTRGEFVASVSADDTGAFVVESDSWPDVLTLEISMAGYNSTEIIVDSKIKDFDLGDVYLVGGVALDEVTVTGGEKLDIKGRTIIFPSAADVRASSTSVALFQKLPLPGLEVSPISRSITVDGGTPMILIDGVPSSMDEVNSLQPKDIAKIEFSRVTPARYADYDKSGLVAITMKKRTDGGYVYMWGRSAVTTAFVDADINASYHQGPSRFALYYSPSWRNYQRVYDDIAEDYIGDDFRVRLLTSDRSPFNYSYHQMRLKYDYSPNKRTLFSVTFKATPSANKSRVIAHTDDSELGWYDSHNVSKGNNFSPSLDLFLRHDFNDRNSLEAQAVGTLSSNDYRRDNHYTFADGSEQTYVMNVDSRRRSLISEVSYIHDFSDRTQLSVGYQNTVSRSTNTYLTTDDRPLLTENNNYVYARLGQQIGDVYLSAATGAKLFWIKNDLNRRHFIRNLSSLKVSWRIDNRWNVTGAFRYSPSIPSLTALTDYPQQISPYLVSNGNPDLKVAERFLFQLMPGFQYKKLNTSLLMSVDKMNNRVISDVAYLGDGLFLSQSINVKSSYSYRTNLNVKISDIYGFGLNAYAGFVRYTCSCDSWSHTLNSFEGSFTLWWTKGPYTISYWRKFPGKNLWGHYVGKDENGDALQLEYKPNKHWTFGASWMYMFDRKGTRYPSWDYSDVNPAFRDRHIKDNGNMVVLSVSYNADFGSIFNTARRNLDNSDGASSLLKM